MRRRKYQLRAGGCRRRQARPECKGLSTRQSTTTETKSASAVVLFDGQRRCPPARYPKEPEPCDVDRGVLVHGASEQLHGLCKLRGYHGDHPTAVRQRGPQAAALDILNASRGDCCMPPESRSLGRQLRSGSFVAVEPERNCRHVGAPLSAILPDVESATGDPRSLAAACADRLDYSRDARGSRHRWRD